MSLSVTSSVAQGLVLAPSYSWCIWLAAPLLSNPLWMLNFVADDCMIYSVVGSWQDQKMSNHNFFKCGNWCERWEIKINYPKTFSFRVTRKNKQHDFQYTVDNVFIDHRNKKKIWIWQLHRVWNGKNMLEIWGQKHFKKLCFLHRKWGKHQTSIGLMTQLTHKSFSYTW